MLNITQCLFSLDEEEEQREKVKLSPNHYLTNVSYCMVQQLSIGTCTRLASGKQCKTDAKRKEAQRHATGCYCFADNAVNMSKQ